MEKVGSVKALIVLMSKSSYNNTIPAFYYTVRSKWLLIWKTFDLNEYELQSNS